MGSAVEWISLQGFVKTLDRIRVPPHSLISVGELEVEGGGVRVEPHGLLELGDGALVLRLPGLHHAGQVDVCDGFRFQGPRLFECARERCQVSGEQVGARQVSKC